MAPRGCHDPGQHRTGRQIWVTDQGVIRTHCAQQAQQGIPAIAVVCAAYSSLALVSPFMLPQVSWGTTFRGCKHPHPRRRTCGTMLQRHEAGGRARPLHQEPSDTRGPQLAPASQCSATSRLPRTAAADGSPQRNNSIHAEPRTVPEHGIDSKPPWMHHGMCTWISLTPACMHACARHGAHAEHRAPAPASRQAPDWQRCGAPAPPPLSTVRPPRPRPPRRLRHCRRR